MKKLIGAFLIALLATAPVFSLSPAVRIKDIARVLEARDNQLMGFGLVVGLKNTGDSNQSVITKQALSNVLTRMGLKQTPDNFKSRNVAAVMVTAELPPFLKPGQKIDIQVSSMGDATSLKGGILILTPLQGPDGQVYAVAQGPVALGLDSVEKVQGRGPEVQGTAGKIVQGALVEKEVLVDFKNKDYLTLVLNQKDFTTAARLAAAIERGGIPDSKALDAGTIQVPLTSDDRANIVDFISRLEDFLLIPDSVARVIVNQKTGIVVIGENVKLAPVAITTGGIDVEIAEGKEVTPKNPSDQKFIKLTPGATLSSLVNALNNLGTSPKDLISILQALRSSGALMAELEVI